MRFGAPDGDEDSVMDEVTQPEEVPPEFSTLAAPRCPAGATGAGNGKVATTTESIMLDGDNCCAPLRSAEKSAKRGRTRQTEESREDIPVEMKLQNSVSSAYQALSRNSPVVVTFKHRPDLKDTPPSDDMHQQLFSSVNRSVEAVHSSDHQPGRQRHAGEPEVSRNELRQTNLRVGQRQRELIVATTSRKATGISRRNDSKVNPSWSALPSNGESESAAHGGVDLCDDSASKAAASSVAGSHRKSLAAKKADVWSENEKPSGHALQESVCEGSDAKTQNEDAENEVVADVYRLKFAPSKPQNRKRPPSRFKRYPVEAQDDSPGDEDVQPVRVGEDMVRSILVDDVNGCDDDLGYVERGMVQFESMKTQKNPKIAAENPENDVEISGDEDDEDEAHSDHDPLSRRQRARPAASWSAEKGCDETMCRERLRWCIKQGLGVVDMSHMAMQDEHLHAVFSELVEQGANTWALRLSYNRLTRLPESIVQLQNLAILLVSHNELDALPEALGDCAKLKELDASRNKLLYLPRSIYSLSSLTSLNLSDNCLSAFPPAGSQKGLHSLSVLNLNNNRFVQIPDELSLAPLTVLDISYNSLLGLPGSFEKLIYIRKFYIDHNPLVDRIPKMLMKANNPLALVTHLSGRR